MRRSLAALFGGALVAALPGLAAAQDINTRTGATDSGYDALREYDLRDDGPGQVYSAKRDIYNVGQTFRVVDPGRAVLDQFSMWTSAYHTYDNPGELVFRAFLLEWDAAYNRPNAGAGILWQSDDQRGTTDATGIQNYDRGIRTDAGWVERAFTPGISLDPGKTYLALLSTAGTSGAYLPSQWATNLVRTVHGGAYTAGDRVFSRSYYLPQGDASGALLDFDVYSGDYLGSTYSPSTSYDIDFQARFSSGVQAPAGTVTPEPVSMALLGTGLAGLGALRRRRRRTEAGEA